ncbi:MAG TPA: hypothetical protein VMD07_06940 [Candidatus Acidoferrales bacterium]|nr:hypothetical protein [Candidatus Acidoferrales bacterium]
MLVDALTAGIVIEEALTPEIAGNVAEVGPLVDGVSVLDVCCICEVLVLLLPPPPHPTSAAAQTKASVADAKRNMREIKRAPYREKSPDLPAEVDGTLAALLCPS